jgi:hypothetical protein
MKRLKTQVHPADAAALLAAASADTEDPEDPEDTEDDLELPKAAPLGKTLLRVPPALLDAGQVHVPPQPALSQYTLLYSTNHPCLHTCAQHPTVNMMARAPTRAATCPEDYLLFLLLEAVFGGLRSLFMRHVVFPEQLGALSARSNELYFRAVGYTRPSGTVCFERKDDATKELLQTPPLREILARITGEKTVTREQPLQWECWTLSVEPYFPPVEKRWKPEP